MKPLSKERRIEIEELLTKGCRDKTGKYVILRLKRKGKNIRMKRSRAYFQYFNRIELTQSEIVHHSDENKKNDDITNLEIYTLEEHISHHHAGLKKPRSKK